MEVKTYGNWIPNKGKVMVGDREMAIKELAASKRDAVAKVLGGGLDLAEMFQPLLDAGRKRNVAMKELVAAAMKAKKKPTAEELDLQLDAASENEVNVFTILIRMQSKIMSLIQGELTLLSCVVLDVDENRSKDDKIEQHPAHGFLHSPALFRWIEDNLSAHQEVSLFEGFLAVNDFKGLAKKYMALVSSTAQEAQDPAPMKMAARAEAAATP